MVEKSSMATRSKCRRRKKAQNRSLKGRINEDEGDAELSDSEETAADDEGVEATEKEEELAEHEKKEEEEAKKWTKPELRQSRPRLILSTSTRATGQQKINPEEAVSETGTKGKNSDEKKLCPAYCSLQMARSFAFAWQALTTKLEFSYMSGGRKSDLNSQRDHKQQSKT